MAGADGKCGCGEIRLHFNQEDVSVINCHCEACRSHNGAAFTTYVIVQANGFELVDKHRLLRGYQEGSSHKYFCGNCGTPLYNTNDEYPSICLVYLGSLEQTEALNPNINVWCENQLDWVNAMAEIKSVAQGAA